MMVKNGIKKIIELTREKKVIPIRHNVDHNELLKNKVAVVIGGTGGIGIAIAKSFLECGCKVIICGTNNEKLTHIVSEIQNDNVKSMLFDVSDTKMIKDNVIACSHIFDQIDILVYSAGIHLENADFFKITPEEYDRVMNINIKGAYFVCREFAEYMIKDNDRDYMKHILIISSSRGSEPAWSPYGVSKWALNGLTQGLSQILLPHGIVVNGLAPGSTATGLIGIKEGDSIYSNENAENRLIMPDEVANIAKLLVSPSGDMVVGETIHISGGRGIFDVR